MVLAVSTASVPGDIQSKLDIVARTGFTGVDLYDFDVFCAEISPAAIGEHAKQLGLTIQSLHLVHDLEGLHGTARQQACDRLDYALDLAEGIGAPTLLVASSTLPDADADISRICADFAEFASKAAARGRKLALQALPWATHLTTDLKAYEIVCAVDHPALGLGLNAFHSLVGGALPTQLRSIAGEKLFHVGLADSPTRIPAWTPALQQPPSILKSIQRVLPGQGELPLAGFVRVIARSGYRGGWSLAPVSDSNRHPRSNYAHDGFRAMVSLLDEVGQTEPTLQQPLAGLPARVNLEGFEFIEFAVDDAAYAKLTQVLEALCFRRERRHIQKPVELWRQGAINIVVNSSRAQQKQRSPDAAPVVSELGLRVKNAHQTVERAKTLGAPEFTKPAQAGELSLPGIKGVGESIVHFIDERSDLHRLWDIEFCPVSTTPAIPPAGLRRIDHIAQTMPYQDMQSWLTFYTSTFVMDKAAIVGVSDPTGQVLSQAITSPEGEVRLNLNGANEAHTLAGTFLTNDMHAGVQHIAFLSEDIFETSAHLARANFPRLTVPQGYYDNLAVHFGLPPERIAQLKAGNIFYDRDGDEEYYQIYSTPLFQGFFFEIVERRRGYEGYGARNAPVRLAAQTQFLQQ